MSVFNREKFLFWLLGLVIAYQGILFGFALYSCSTRAPGTVTTDCPDIGTRWDNYQDKTLAAVLGLIAGGAALGTVATRKKPDAEGSEPPIQPAIKKGPLDGPPRSRN